MPKMRPGNCCSSRGMAARTLSDVETSFACVVLITSRVSLGTPLWYANTRRGSYESVTVATLPMCGTFGVTLHGLSPADDEDGVPGVAVVGEDGVPPPPP